MEKAIGMLMEQIHDNTLRTKMLYRMIKKLRKVSRNQACAILLIDIYLVGNEIRWNLQKQANQELRKELNELKQTKGV